MSAQHGRKDDTMTIKEAVERAAGHCEQCVQWQRDKRNERSGTCKDWRNAVFFGAPEEENPEPNMLNMTWTWDKCQHFSARPDHQ